MLSILVYTNLLDNSPLALECSTDRLTESKPLYTISNGGILIGRSVITHYCNRQDLDTPSTESHFSFDSLFACDV